MYLCIAEEIAARVIGKAASGDGAVLVQAIGGVGAIRSEISATGDMLLRVPEQRGGWAEVVEV